jgi:hypothetical protein
MEWDGRCGGYHSAAIPMRNTSCSRWFVFKIANSTKRERMKSSFDSIAQSQKDAFLLRALLREDRSI